MNKIHIIGVGGAGTNIVSKFETHGFERLIETEKYYLDTSDANFTNDLSNTFRIESSKNTENIFGSGGDRKSGNAKSIIKSIDEFLDKYDLNNPKKNEFFVIVNSLSGGSGSIIGPVLMESLQKRDANVTGVVVSDSKDEISNMNSMNTMKTYMSLATKNGFITTLAVFDNFEDETNTTKNIDEVNKIIHTYIRTHMVFFSDSLISMDQSDMGNFVSPHRYKSIQLDSGVNVLSYIPNNEYIKNTSNYQIVLARHITTDENQEISTGSKHDKTGVLKDNEIISKYEGKLPLSLIQEVGIIPLWIESYENRHNELYNKKFNVSEVNIDNSDEDGLVL